MGVQNPSMFGCSLLPKEPERCLSFHITKMDSKKALLSALFYFKAMGFAKPVDEVVDTLSSCQATNFTVDVYMGPKGLTKIAVRLSDCTWKAAERLADILRFDFRGDLIDDLNQKIGKDCNVISY